MFLAPVYAAFFFLPSRWDAGALPCAVIVLILSILIELSDILDGHVARRLGQVSDWGKTADPLADVMSRLTYFMCFTLAGFIYPWVLFVLFFRELGMILLRLSLTQKGLVLGAGLAGKIKSAAYGVTGVLGSFCFLMVVSRGPGLNYESAGLFGGGFGSAAGPFLFNMLRAVAVLSAGLSVFSLAWYLIKLRRKMR